MCGGVVFAYCKYSSSCRVFPISMSLVVQLPQEHAKVAVYGRKPTASMPAFVRCAAITDSAKKAKSHRQMHLHCAMPMKRKVFEAGQGGGAHRNMCAHPL